MQDPSSWNRREFEVTQAGYFSVLRPGRWIPAFRLPGGFRYLIRADRKLRVVAPSAITDASATARENAQCPQIPILQWTRPEARSRYALLRIGLVVLSALAIAGTLLRMLFPA
jgi:hypothetical protein